MSQSAAADGEFVTAIHAGDVAALRRLLAEWPDLATAVHRDEHGNGRTALHLATDWPGGFPNVAATIAVLVEAGADVDAEFDGAHRERPLHWAVSSNDTAATAALLGAGADVEADGGVLTGGPPLDDAVIFRNIDAALLLVDAGAQLSIWHAAALGLDDRLAALIAGADGAERTNALWHAAANGQHDAAELLLAAGADRAWIGHDGMTPAAVAAANGHPGVAARLGRD